jgi:hypothetical protein
MAQFTSLGLEDTLVALTMRLMLATVGCARMSLRVASGVCAPQPVCFAWALFGVQIAGWDSCLCGAVLCGGLRAASGQAAMRAERPWRWIHASFCRRSLRATSWDGDAVSELEIE